MRNKSSTSILACAVATALAAMPGASAQNDTPAGFVSLGPYEPNALTERIVGGQPDGTISLIATSRLYSPDPDHEAAWMLIDPVTMSIVAVPTIVSDAGGRRTASYGLSPDGLEVAGFNNGFVDSEGFVWTPSVTQGGDAFRYLIGAFDGGTSKAWGIAQNGLVVGDSKKTVNLSGRGKKTRLATRAAAWDETGGIEPLGIVSGYLSSTARVVSSDGLMIAGMVVDIATTTTGGMSRGDIAVWRGPDRELTVVDGFDPGQSSVHAVSLDGSVVVGDTRAPGTSYLWPYRWDSSSGGVQISLLEGWNPDHAGRASEVSVTPQGTVVLGSVDVDPTSSGGVDGFIWRSDGSQVVLISDLLEADYPEIFEDQGFPNVSAARNAHFNALSEDGRVIGFDIDNDDGTSEGYVLVLQPRIPVVTSFTATPDTQAGTVTLAVRAHDPAGFLKSVTITDGAGFNQMIPASVDGYVIEGLPGSEIDLATAVAVATDTDTKSSLPVGVSVVTPPTPPPGATNDLYAVAKIVIKTKGRKTDLRARVTVYRDTSLVDGADDLEPGINVTVHFGPEGSPTSYSGLSDGNGEFESPWQSAGSSSFTATVDNSEPWNESLSSLQATWPP
jgi:hypothetical protein